ncbi:MAG: hypothetical protein AAF485_25375, partial [Chloroflexota bacterium]
IQFIFQPTTIGGDYTGSGGLVTNIRGSSLLPWFNQLLWILVQSVDLFIPANADILRKVVEFVL